MNRRMLASLAVLGAFSLPLVAQAEDDAVVIDGITYPSFEAYFETDHFRENGRCATPMPTADQEADFEFRGGSGADCGNSTNPLPIYDPLDQFTIRVVVHVISNTSGQGDIADSMVESQIDILNEDFQALFGTPGEPGTDGRIAFALATEDPSGNPTDGIDRHTNNNWYNDSGNYWNTIAWDPTRYMNIYTLGAPGGSTGILGYVPWLPHVGAPGSLADRVVIGWRYFGRNSPGAPYNQGRTATHEVGHYLGLYHTFQGGCGTASCYTTGDRICDTEPEQSSRFGCPGSATSCSTPDPYHNYMDYTNDTCMWEFTPEQVNRNRCTLDHYRPDIYDTNPVVAVGDAGSSASLFSLHQNRPNPFNPTTHISYQLHQAGDVALTILDANGRVVKSLVAQSMSEGLHEINWDGTDNASDPVASGVYFYRLETAGESFTRRMVLLK
jgi:hypothetical protein